jgi:L-asparaginase II
MLAACAAAGWPITGYRDPDHPVQQRLRAAVEELTGERVATVGVDGCGAPLFAVSLRGLARAFARLATAAAGTPEHRVVAAMRAHPDLVGGTGRDVTALMRAVDGLVAKDGAEGVYAVGLGAGIGVAVKIEDGTSRARVPVLLELLRELGVPQAALDTVPRPDVLGHGVPVGEVRAFLR